MSMSKLNTTFTGSNLATVNQKMEDITVFRAPGADNLLWDQSSIAAAA